MQKLREAAQSRFSSILASIDNGTSQPSSADGEGGSNTALQQRLEKAIRSLQDGLVERDTEASPPKNGNLWATNLAGVQLHPSAIHLMAAGSAVAVGSIGGRAHSLHWTSRHCQE